MEKNQLAESIQYFEAQKDLLITAEKDISDAQNNEKIYSLDFAILFPYIIPHRLQPRLDDPLRYICNNIFLLLDEDIKLVPIELAISFPTTMEIVDKFSKQKSYFDRIAESEDVARVAQEQLITGERAAQIIQREVQAHLPDDGGYACLAKFVNHLKQSRITGLGDHFDIDRFRDSVQPKELEQIKDNLDTSAHYHSNDNRNVAFRRDMDALHLAMTKHYHDQGVLYTGTRGTRKAFGTQQTEYTRPPEVLLCLMHALNQANGNDSDSLFRGMKSFFNNGIDFFDESIKSLSRAKKLTDFSGDELRLLGEKDRIYRREMYMDRRSNRNRQTDDEVKSIVKGMTTSQFRDVNKLASEKISANVSDLSDVLSLKPTDDLLDFLSPEGKDYVSEALERFDKN